MSKADKMFEELGYRKKQKGQYIEYIKVENSVKEEYAISFMMKTVMATLYCGGYFKKSLPLDMQELQAIHEKCKELGWVGE